MSRLMARRKHPDKKVGHERWLVSYSDFVTLLFAFFVVMYSVSQVNESKYKALAETLNATFTQNSSSGDVEYTSSEPEPIADLKTLTEEIKESLQGFPVQGEMSLGANENWVELTLSSELLFDSGKADPSTEAKRIFSKLATQLESYDNEIQVVGHTDDVPISNEEFSSNWALSSARAVAIVNFFAFQGIQPEQMSAVAFGEYRPIADNATEEGRSKNRRVVLRISDQAAPAAKVLPRTLFPSDVPSTDSEDNSESTPEATTRSGDFITPSDSSSNLVTDAPIKPVRLKGGDLLFTSDPDLPRLRALESDDLPNQESE